MSGTRIRLALLLLPVMIAVGCGTATKDETTPRPASRSSPQQPPTPSIPATLTQAEAADVFARYQATASASFAAAGRGLQATETGVALQLDRGWLDLARLRGQRPERLPRAMDVQYYIPRRQSFGPEWFVAAYRKDGQAGHAQVVLANTDHGWRAVIGTWTRRPLPTIATAPDGRATAVGPDSMAGLRISPRRLAEVHASLLSSFDRRGQQSGVLADGTYTSSYVAALRADAETLEREWAMRLRVRPFPAVYALSTTDGGVVAWYGLMEQQDYHVAMPQAGRMGFTRAAERAFTKGAFFSRHVTVTAVSAFAAAIPRSAAPARVLGGLYAVTGVRGK
ncbi:hypothetical protein DQ384_36665 [Sphaerisporangium album]|uniref:DUF8094 domain-containing protein n=1 Tax=Sphaerisporangium album TaxID=509200 RepID=A0A367ETT5_9ACTN|nr:hypothetical protein [Sphaerisporangium album]RCG21149.1 hypothetical protein DQ384_36665 [Sphaerisporangium album]